jgi:endonuclease/exonuclease/phosphatase (EEP) superfamily protein YafD
VKRTVNEQPTVKPSIAKRFVASAAISLLRITAMLSIVTLFASHWWIADLLTNFRVQMCIGICGLLFLVLVTRQWTWVAIGIVLLVFHGWRTAPYLIPRTAPTAQTTQQNFRLLTANVLTSNSSYASLVELLRKEQPDFVVLMEINKRWAEHLDVLEDLYPHQELHPREHNFGIAILSRQPWTKMESMSFGDIELPWLKAKFKIGADTSTGLPLEIIAVHPLPPVSARNADYRNTQLMEISSQVDLGSARIVTGDFNLTPWSPWFNKVARETQTTDAAHGFGLTRTWEVFPTIIGGLKIDHALVSDEVEVQEFRVGPDIGSDHRPVIVDFSVDVGE